METALGIIGAAFGAGALAVTFAVMSAGRADAERRCADARVAAADLAGKLAIAATSYATLTAEVAEWRRRADALENDLAQAEVDSDPHGARERVLQRWREAHAADAPGRAGADAVPEPSSASTSGPSEAGKPN